jgi:1-acyl-sn-glycerol-3-phosphate acyltransferase
LNVLRSTLFALIQALVTPPYALLALLTFPLPRMARYRIISGWSRLIVFFAKAILGIDWRIEGRENLPSRPAVILAKHQSAWETMAFQLIFPPHVHVLKRELLWIPFFGWGLALMSPIAINRSRGVSALRAIARRGRERLAQGFWVVVFPEGTRVPPGAGGAGRARGGGGAGGGGGAPARARARRGAAGRAAAPPTAGSPSSRSSSRAIPRGEGAGRIFVAVGCRLGSVVRW